MVGNKYEEFATAMTWCLQIDSMKGQLGIGIVTTDLGFACHGVTFLGQQVKEIQEEVPKCKRHILNEGQFVMGVSDVNPSTHRESQ